MPYFGACGRNQYYLDASLAIEEVRQALADARKFIGRIDLLLNTQTVVFRCPDKFTDFILRPSGTTVQNHGLDPSGKKESGWLTHG